MTHLEAEGDLLAPGGPQHSCDERLKLSISPMSSNTITGSARKGQDAERQVAERAEDPASQAQSLLDQVEDQRHHRGQEYPAEQAARTGASGVEPCGQGGIAPSIRCPAPATTAARPRAAIQLAASPPPR